MRTDRNIVNRCVNTERNQRVKWPLAQYAVPDPPAWALAAVGRSHTPHHRAHSRRPRLLEPGAKSRAETWRGGLTEATVGRLVPWRRALHCLHGFHCAALCLRRRRNVIAFRGRGWQVELSHSRCAVRRRSPLSPKRTCRDWAGYNVSLSGCYHLNRDRSQVCFADRSDIAAFRIDEMCHKPT